MERLRNPGTVERLQLILDVIPSRMQELLRFELAVDIDPLFVGLHCWEHASDGRSYHDMEQVVYENHQQHLPRAHRATTVVLRKGSDFATIAHELGHVLHCALGFEPEPKPINEYAAYNSHEAFACAFASWLYRYDPWFGSVPDPATRYLLDSLCQ